MRSGHGDFGARVIARDRTRFRLWAPDCAEITLEIEGHPPLPMAQVAPGIFAVEAEVGGGARYRYRVAPDRTVPDPASRAQSHDVHDHSVVVDTGEFLFHTPDWRGRPWHEVVIYELHVGLYGGFAAVGADLVRLASLGITAIELMPIADFPGERNWGYDGVLPYAPDASYGTPQELCALIDAAHGLGLMVFLDVVYNHFGPSGNYLGAYAACFFRQDLETPWGGAIDFRVPEVQRFFIDNALYWLHEYRFDGLRFDAVHAIAEAGFLPTLARAIRDRTPPARHVHLMVENERNDAALLGPGRFDAQWNDDFHHCVHVLLTGENEGYYRDYQRPAEQLARVLAQGFAYQGEPSPHAGGTPRGTPSGDLPPTCFVACLQNHDQIGNRAMGDRLTTLAGADALDAATLLLLLMPQTPLLFAGEEWAETRPFLFFTDYDDALADAVRNGRRREFAHFRAFQDEATRAAIPDPNAPQTFTASQPRQPHPLAPEQRRRLVLIERALAIRAAHLVPQLPNTTALEARTIGEACVLARYRLGGDGAVLTLAANLGHSAVALPPIRGSLLIGSRDDDDGAAPDPARLRGFTTAVWLTSE